MLVRFATARAEVAKTLETQPDFAAAHARIAEIALQLDEEYVRSGAQQSNMLDRAANG